MKRKVERFPKEVSMLVIQDSQYVSLYCTIRRSEVQYEFYSCWTRL